MVCARLLLIIVKILINRISSTGFKKTGYNVVALMDPMTGIIIITSIALRWPLAAEKHAVYHSLAANANRMRLYETSNAAMMYAENHM